MNRYLTKIAYSESLHEGIENPHYVRAGARATIEGVGTGILGGFAGRLLAKSTAGQAARNVGGMVGKSIGTVAGAVHGYRASMINQRKEENQ